jgi:hypothetical protein
MSKQEVMKGEVGQKLIVLCTMVLLRSCVVFLIIHCTMNNLCQCRSSYM